MLVHRHLSDLQEAEYTGLKILGISLLLGLILTALLAAALARRFIAPLYSMKDTAESFMGGNYAARTGLRPDDELGLLAKSLDELGHRLGETEAERNLLQQQRQEFLAAVSHELRTPLTVIKGTWELLQSGFVQEEGKLSDCRRRIEDNLSMMELLVRDLLELTRLQSPGFEVQKEPLDLAEPFHEALRSARTLAEKKGVAIHANLPSPLPFTGDYGRLRQLLLILLDNAIKFSPAGAEVLVECSTNGNNWELKVKDQGPGIPAEDLPHIFDRFKKGGPDNAQGTGLGLAIAREIALRHDIEITCESYEGQGAVFLMQYPS
ncbi:MAG: HAMP domain-containing histidine kinase [Selenomonadaceae bacterium]|nr:HAMP domain-containing histidine kinase [Selenomonadaceae bacterium]